MWVNKLGQRGILEASEMEDIFSLLAQSMSLTGCLVVDVPLCSHLLFLGKHSLQFSGEPGLVVRETLPSPGGHSVPHTEIDVVYSVVC